MISRALARRIGAGVLALAVVEWAAAAWAYRTRVGPDDWERAREAVAALPEGEPVLLGTPWLASRARLHVPALRDRASAAAPDLRGMPTFHVLGLDDSWSSELQADLEGLAPPTLDDSQDLGSLTLHRYRLEGAHKPVSSLLDAPDLEVAAGAPCTGGPKTWRCRGGTVIEKMIEVDYRPRRCLAIDVGDDTLVSLRVPSMATGDVLRGHVGFDDFNRRLRSDAPVELGIHVDGREAAAWMVTDEQGWWPFAVAVPPGTHELEVRIRTVLRGTWQRDGYAHDRQHAVCVELRSFLEGGT